MNNTPRVKRFRDLFYLGHRRGECSVGFFRGNIDCLHIGHKWKINKGG